MWYLKSTKGSAGFPSAIELLCKRYEDIFTILNLLSEVLKFTC